MVGHKLWQVMSEGFETYVTLRADFANYARFKLFDRGHTIDRVETENFDSIVRAVAAVRPQVVINCIGIVKQHPAAADPLSSISVNALFPHRLAHLCRAAGIRLLHISTDCVFSGRRGRYSETDIADAEDLYGRSKFLGEVSYDGCLTLRTSMIGHELMSSHGLVEWVLSQDGKTIHGYPRAIFSGFTTKALAKLIIEIIEKYPAMQGVWHVASEPVSKFHLLSLVKDTYGLKLNIEADDTVVYDRSLDDSRFRRLTRFIPPTWPVMIEQMFTDSAFYAEFRRFHAK
jgi:dTDP-4-dehydrorhamnose reductase